MSLKPNFYEVACNHTGELVVGSFTVSAGGVPQEYLGTGFTAAHTSTGVYTVTLNDTFQSLINFRASILRPSGDKVITGGPVSLSAKTARIYRWDLTTPSIQDMVSPNERLCFRFCLGVTTV